MQLFNSTGATDSLVVEVQVQPINDPPVIVYQDGTPYQQEIQWIKSALVSDMLTLYAYDPDIGDTVSWSLSNSSNFSFFQQGSDSAVTYLSGVEGVLYHVEATLTDSHGVSDSLLIIAV